MNKIAIHSVPRSGSTWLANIFDSHPDVIFRFQPLFSYAFKDFLDNTSTHEDIENFFEKIKVSDDPFLTQEEGKKKGIIPVFKKNQNPTHVCYKEVRYNHIIQNLLENDDEIIVIGIIRNPLATLNSWWRAPKEFRRDLGWQISEEWEFAPKKNKGKVEEFNGYKKWKEVTELFLKLKSAYQDRFYILNYDTLLQTTNQEVKNLFKFCDLEIPDQTLEFLSKSSSKNDSNAYSVFKSKDNDDKWKDELPEFIIKEIVEDPFFIRFNKIFNWV